MELSDTTSSAITTKKIVDTLIRLLLLIALFTWCFTVVKPFLLVLIWGAIIAIPVYPVYTRLMKWFHGRKVIPAIMVALCMFGLIIVPTWFIAESVMTGVNHIRENVAQGQPVIPPPGDLVQNWPSIAKPVVDVWQQASDNLQGAIMQHQEQFAAVGTWLLSAISGLGKGIVQFVLSILVAAVLLVFSSSLKSSALKILQKLSPDFGETFLNLSVDTVNTVVKGVIGVAAIQAAMAGVAFYIAGIPFAGIWTLVCLVLSMVQIGSWPVFIPMTIYMFSTHTGIVPFLFAGWMVVVTLTDNILTPLMMGRGSSVPMLVVFLGTIGGFMAIGFLGLFVGAVSLSIFYKLFLAWLDEEGDVKT